MPNRDELIEALRPMCAQCGVLVPEFKVFSALSEPTVVFEARCHGEVERSEISHLEVALWGQVWDVPTFKKGTAFLKTTSLLDPPAELHQAP